MDPATGGHKAKEASSRVLVVNKTRSLTLKRRIKEYKIKVRDKATKDKSCRKLTRFIIFQQCDIETDITFTSVQRNPSKIKFLHEFQCL